MIYQWKMYLQICACCIIFALVSACVADVEPRDLHAERPKIIDLVGINYAAVERLVDNHQSELSSAKPILVTSIVDIDDLELSSTFGRLIAEQVGSRLAQMGYTVKELKLRGQVLVRQQSGEFMLSRDIKRLRGKYGAQTIVAGTYAAGTSFVYVNLRLIRADDARVVSSFDYSVPIDMNVLSLIETNGIRTYNIEANWAR